MSNLKPKEPPKKGKKGKNSPVDANAAVSRNNQGGNNPDHVDPNNSVDSRNNQGGNNPDAPDHVDPHHEAGIILYNTLFFRRQQVQRFRERS